MSTGTTASLWLTLLSVVLSVSGEPTNITAEPGQTVSLTCTTPNKEPVTVLEWRRTDMKTDEYVLFYRDDQFDPDYQHPSYKNRVDLQDRNMKDGNVSLTLKNATDDDRGTYECRVVQTKTNRRKRSFLDSDPIFIIRLDVASSGHTSGHKGDGGDKDGGDKEGGHKEGPVGLIVGLIVTAVLVAVVGFLIFRRHKHPGPYHPPPDPGSQQL